jgi:hypothetical protein
VTFIGDLERAFATWLYPNRVAVAIAVVLGLLGLVLLARQRGWFAAAKRHRVRTSLLIAVLLAIGLPGGWYLGSPLFITVSLEEPAPSIGAPGLATAGPATSPGGTAVSAAPTNSAPTAEPTPALAAARSGTFHGADDFHFGKGTASLVETTPGVFTVRFDGFSVRNGPDLYVYLSTDPAGYSTDGIEIGPLRATDGSFNMAAPAGVDPSGARSVVIWCKQFSVLFAVAPLT